MTVDLGLKVDRVVSNLGHFVHTSLWDKIASIYNTHSMQVGTQLCTSMFMCLCLINGCNIYNTYTQTHTPWHSLQSLQKFSNMYNAIQHKFHN